MQKGSFIQINCRPAIDVQVGDRIVQGLLISPEDRAFLRSLGDSEVIVSLVCTGRITLHARGAPLIKRMVPVPYSEDWYISITATGPLYEKDK